MLIQIFSSQNVKSQNQQKQNSVRNLWYPIAGCKLLLVRAETEVWNTVNIRVNITYPGGLDSISKANNTWQHNNNRKYISKNKPDTNCTATPSEDTEV